MAMNPDEMTEQGPDAAATTARLTERRTVMMGEGISAEVGRDGDTFCVLFDGGTLLDFMRDEDVSELDWRQSRSVRRFASESERDAFVAAQDWSSSDDDGSFGDRVRQAFHLRLAAGLTDS